MARQNNMMFTTKDSDDDRSGGNCARTYHGAWWYKSCHDSHLNGDYSLQRGNNAVHWYHWENTRDGLRETKMMIRPQFN